MEDYQIFLNQKGDATGLSRVPALIRHPYRALESVDKTEQEDNKGYHGVQRRTQNSNN